MTRLERLKVEAARVKVFFLLPPQMKRTLEIFYEREIDAIEKYGAENPEFKRPKRKAD